MSLSRSTTPSAILPSLSVALCGTIWGLYWLPLRWVQSEGVGSAWVSVIFNVMAIATTLPWLLRREAWRGLAQQSISGFLLGTAFSLYTVSLSMTEVINAVLLFYLTPVWSTIAGWLFFRERMGPGRIGSIAAGFAGLAAVLGFDQGIPFPRNLGDWLALISGLCWAAGTMHSYRRPTGRIALPVFSFSLGGLLSSALILVLAAAMDAPMAQGDQLVNMLPWIVLLSFVIFVPPNFLVLWAAQRIDPARIGILLMTEVLVGSMSAALLSGEPFGLRQAAGTALIASAGLVEVLRR